MNEISEWRQTPFSVGLHPARMRKTLAAFLVAAIGVATPALAYRPFDGTDGDVAEPGQFELEIGPAYTATNAAGRSIAAPATVFNFGVARGLELVVDMKPVVDLRPAAGEPRTKILDTDVMLKTVLRRGTLQDETGVSIALEAGPLLPEINGDNSFGAQANLITSYRWDAVSAHLNTAVGLTREHRMDTFAGLILEGPHEWTVRPVSEIYSNREFGVGATYSALAGAIWQVRDRLAVDAAVRYASEPENHTVELRFGMTWGVSL
jgi:hypothetical protein